ncbi:MAG: right-handed parallel beta-helix repeat-containing protein [Candidatus Thorarchaeota archaeon]
MESEVEIRSRICPITPKSKKGLNPYLKPRTILIAASLTFILTAAGLAYYWMQPPPYLPPLPIQSIPHDVMEIDGDANFAATALLEGWPGDGSPANPYIIEGLEIAFGGAAGNCISIRNTRVSFTIRNCNLTGARGWSSKIDGAGIFLENVTNGKLANNICSNNSMNGIRVVTGNNNAIVANLLNDNGQGITLEGHNNIIAGNIANNNDDDGIGIDDGTGNIMSGNIAFNNSDYGLGLHRGSNNIIAENTANSNSQEGIFLTQSNSNTISSNSVHNNSIGISLDGSDYNTVENNTCNNNDYDILLKESYFNTVENNTCNNNDYGTSLEESNRKTVENNAWEPVFEELTHEEFVARESVWFLAGCGMILVTSAIALVQFRRMAKLWKIMSNGEYAS